MTWKKLDAKPQEENQKSDNWDFTKNAIIEGIIRNKKFDVGQFKNSVYTLEDVGGNKWSVWGNFKIDEYLKDIDLGKKIKIEYRGKVLNKNTGRYFKNFDIYIDDTSGDDITTDEIPF